MMRQILLVPAMLALILAFATASSHPVLADPTIRTVDHPLADPALEARARALMREIRCVVCQSQSIDESDADIATNLRNIVREQLAAGESEATIRDYLMARYGDFVLLRPPFKPETALLWIGPFALAAISFAAGLAVLRGNGTIAPDTLDLSCSERERLNRLLAAGCSEEPKLRHRGQS
jgi:cytochrome c-type biogenesis protein CcmH